MAPADRRWSARGPVAVGFLTLAVLIGGFGTWAAVARIAGAVVAPGLIEVDQNRQVVQHPDGGVVAEIRVKEGDSVAADQVLLRLDGSLLRSELAVVEGQYLEVLARRGRLEAERDRAEVIVFDAELVAAIRTAPDHAKQADGQRRLFEARATSLRREVDQMAKQREQIASQIAGIEAQIAATGTQIGLIAEELSAQEQLLAKGLAQVSRVLALKREAASLEGRRGELVAARAQAGERITEIEIAAERLYARRQEEAISTLRDLSFNELDLSERRRALVERIGRLDIRAPVGGAVYGMQVFAPRSVIRAAEPVMFVIPQDRPLVIGARISPLHVDQVQVGQVVRIRFTGLNTRTTPELEATVIQVSADSFADEHTGAYFRARMQLKDGELARLPEGAVLLPGMPVEAYFQTVDRTPLEYLVKPVADYFNRAFRES